MRAKSIFKDSLGWAGMPRTPQWLDPLKTKNLSLFDGGAATEWTRISGGTIADDTTTFRDGSKAIAVTSVNQLTQMDKTVAFDLSAYTHFVLSIYIPDVTKVLQVDLKFSTNSAWTSFYSKAVGQASMHTGWNNITFYVPLFSSSGAPSWATIVRMRVGITSVSNETCVVSCDNLYAIKGAYDKGIVSICFDDSYDSFQSIARPIMDIYHFVGTMYVVPPHIGLDSRYMSLAQVYAVERKYHNESSVHTTARK